jgi:hypothetical protein
MTTLHTNNTERIKEAIEFLYNNQRPITVQIEGKATCFASAIVGVDHGDVLSRSGSSKRLVIEWLSPQEGNDLIQSWNPIRVRFSLGKSECEFTSHYITKSDEPPYFGHMITYPEALIIVDRRTDGRNAIGTDQEPLFAYAKLTIRISGSQEKSYELRVFDVSENGVGLLVSEEQSDLLERTGIGDRLEAVELYAPWTMVRVNGTVRHKSRLREGEGYYLLGIQLDEKLEHYA